MIVMICPVAKEMGFGKDHWPRELVAKSMGTSCISLVSRIVSWINLMQNSSWGGLAGVWEKFLFSIASSFFFPFATSGKLTNRDWQVGISWKWCWIFQGIWGSPWNQACDAETRMNSWAVPQLAPILLVFSNASGITEGFVVAELSYVQKWSCKSGSGI